MPICDHCRTLNAILLCAAFAPSGCNQAPRSDDPFGSASGTEAAGTETSGPQTSGTTVSGGAQSVGSDTGETAGEEGPSPDSDGPNLDVAAPDPDTVGPTDGCSKVDFLFVIDNSISMGDEQQNLATSFPNFIQTIQDDVVSDYHVMVIDTDGEDKWDEELVECIEDDCPGEPADELCGILPPENTWPCGDLPTLDPCDATLGAGVHHDGTDARNECGIPNGRRWLDDAQPNPAAAFDCIANLYAGNSPELTMGGMLAAVSAPMVDAGGCNEGFLRDDAVLVVTFISDEEDLGDSIGDPATWHAELLARKGGNETAVVVLGLLGDTSLADAVCPPDSVPGSNGGEYSPQLIEFVEAFGDRGLWGSVCAPDYGPFFDEAVALIDTACEEFEPEG